MTPDLSFFTRLNYALTYNYSLSATGGNEAKLLEFSTGLAFRPVKYDWAQILLKYTLRKELRPIGLMEGKRAENSTTGVFSLVSIFELPFRLQVTEQFAFKYREEEVDGLQPASSITLLWINRLSYHLFKKKVDLSAEYRFMWLWMGSAGDALALATIEHGLLFEISYNIKRYIRVGAGYNFTSFTDNLFADSKRNYNGFFFRVVGTY